MESITVWGMFWASAAVAVAAFAGLFLNLRVLATQTDPHVVLYTQHDLSRPTVILLIAENIGRGMAYDVQFVCPDPIPGWVFGITEVDGGPPEGFNLGFLGTGIPALGPGARRVLMWGQYGGLRRLLGDRTLDVTVTYQGRGALTHSRENHHGVCPIEVFSHDAGDAVDPDGARQSARQLERIATVAENLLTRETKQR